MPRIFALFLLYLLNQAKSTCINIPSNPSPGESTQTPTETTQTPTETTQTPTETTQTPTETTQTPPEPGESSEPEVPVEGNTEYTKIKWFKQELWDELFPHICYGDCDGCGKYTYDNFMKAVDESPGFLESEDENLNKLELAAFLGQTSHETANTDDHSDTEDAQDKFGYCYITDRQKGPYCMADYAETCYENGYYCQCLKSQEYYGRGPFMLRWNINYGRFGLFDWTGSAYISTPDLLVKTPDIGIRSAIWFWMTPQEGKPSCHDVIIDSTGKLDTEGRGYDYGLCTDILNGYAECGSGTECECDTSRQMYYERFLKIFGVTDTRNKSCKDYSPY